MSSEGYFDGEMAAAFSASKSSQPTAESGEEVIQDSVEYEQSPLDRYLENIYDVHMIGQDISLSRLQSGKHEGVRLKNCGSEEGSDEWGEYQVMTVEPKSPESTVTVGVPNPDNPNQSIIVLRHEYVHGRVFKWTFDPGAFDYSVTAKDDVGGESYAVRRTNELGKIEIIPIIVKASRPVVDTKGKTWSYLYAASAEGEPLSFGIPHKGWSGTECILPVADPSVPVSTEVQGQVVQEDAYSVAAGD